MNFQIRKAQSDDDWDFFFKLSFETLKVLRKFIYDPLVKNNPDASDEEIAKLHRKETEEYFDFSKPDARVFIAKTADGVPCGYLWMGIRNSKDVWDFVESQWIYDIVVDPKFRGNRLGIQLMQKAEKFAREMDFNIGLFVHSDNEPAITLYNETGYIIKTVPISKKLDSINTDDSFDNKFVIREELETERDSIQRFELDRFKMKVRFSADVDDNVIKKLYEEHIGKYSKNGEKHQKFVAVTQDGDFAGAIWVGSSGFNEKVAMIHELVVNPSYENNIVGKILVDFVEKWTKRAEFSTIYVLLHIEDNLDLEFFKMQGYSVPGFFFEKRLKSSVE